MPETPSQVFCNFRDVPRQQFGQRMGFGKRPGLLIVDFTVGFNDPASFGGGTISAAVANTVPLLRKARELGLPVAHTRIVYADEPIKIGRRVGPEVLPAHGGPRPGAGRPPSGNQPVTLRLPPNLIAAVRRRAKRAGQSMSEFVATKLAR